MTPPMNDIISPTGVRVSAAQEIHDLLQRAAGQPSSRDAAAAMWEQWASEVTKAQAESAQPERLAADSRMREARE